MNKELIHTRFAKNLKSYNYAVINLDNNITRAEFVRIINNAFGYTKAAKNVKFNDVEKNSWYYNDIAIGLEQGYINGRSETTFAPNDNITRQEVAKILTTIKNI